jgi:hypothetical protein
VRVRSTLALGAAALAIAALVAAVLDTGPAVREPGPDSTGDAGFYHRVIEQMRAGAGYYEASAAQLRSGPNAIASVFNWRPPLLYAGIAALSEPLSRVILWLLAAALVVRAWPLYRGPIGVLPLLNAVMIAAAAPLVFFTEMWAGLCLGHAAVSYARQDRISGVAWAVTALCLRELSAPFCVVAGTYALWRRDWREVSAWIVGGGIFALYFGWHAANVLAQLHPTDPAQPDSWLAFGGPAFMLRAFQNASGLVLVLPSIVFGLLVAVAVGAWWSPSMPWHVRAGVVAYALFFLVAGLPYNVYWGVIVGPLLGLWLAHADDSTLLRVSAAGGKRSRARTGRAVEIR